jgi:AcrR family transcriptional regulator
MTRRTRSEMQAETRERLLDSARVAFGRKGFAGATIDEIAEAAGFSRGAFYSNFSTKEDLAVELIGQQMALDLARITQVAEAAHGPPESLPERLRAAFPVTGKINEWELLRLEMLMLAQRNPAFAEKCQDLYKPHRQRVADLIRQLFARVGRVPPAEDDVLAYTILSLRLGAALLHEASGPVPLGGDRPTGAAECVRGGLNPLRSVTGRPYFRILNSPVGRETAGAASRGNRLTTESAGNERFTRNARR